MLSLLYTPPWLFSTGNRCNGVCPRCWSANRIRGKRTQQGRVMPNRSDSCSMPPASTGIIGLHRIGRAGSRRPWRSEDAAWRLSLRHDRLSCGPQLPLKTDRIGGAAGSRVPDGTRWAGSRLTICKHKILSSKISRFIVDEFEENWAKLTDCQPAKFARAAKLWGAQAIFLIFRHRTLLPPF